MTPRPNTKRCLEALDAFRKAWVTLIVESIPEHSKADAQELFAEFFKAAPATLDEEFMRIRVNATIEALIAREKIPLPRLVPIR